MTASRSQIWGIVLAGLIVAEAITVYQVLYCLWMLAHPVYASATWSTRLEIRLLTALVLGGAIAFVAIQRWRRKRGISG